MLPKWYWTILSDTPASAAISRMLAASRPRSAAMRHTASAICRRLRDRASDVGAGLSGAGTGGCFRRR
ncbi:hypothetical protein GCM10010449_75770 [Streptomyces rectiviolaceus]|uniref:Uncharacterized protein n=1 Tax=Streptomyces rectiviolaceus TaxID=332591 RepID=A0ABP6NGF3_9ACTN